MALKIAATGHELVGHARDAAKNVDVAAAGAVLTASLTDAVESANLICVNVFDETQLRNALIEGGALAAMRSGAILVIHSKVGPALIREIAAIRSDIRVLDAPFSGKDSDAASGRIALMVGGDESDLEEVSPVLGRYANFIQLMGPLGAGATTKLVNNALFGAQMLLAHDALRVLSDGGIDQDTALLMLGRSSGASFALGQHGGGIDAWDRLQGIWPYIQKDVTVAGDAAEESELDLGMLDTATRPYLKGAP